MPVYEVTDPQSGVKLELTGDSPPTEQELEQIFASQTQPTPQQAEPAAPAPMAETTAPEEASSLGGVAETAATMVSGMAAEPIAGLAGLLSLPFTDADQASKNIASVQEALTYVPKTPEGMATLQKVAEVMQPVGEAMQAAEKFTGEAGYEAAGPIGGAVGATLPTAAITALGFGPVRRALKLGKAARAEDKAVKRLLGESAPTADALKTTARGIYNELDNIGAIVDSKRIDRLGVDLASTAKRQGFNKRIHPKVSAALDEVSSIKGINQNLTEIDTLRKVVKAAAGSIEPSEARLGAMLVNKIDDFLDDIKPSDFVAGKAEDIGGKFKDARQLWQRAKKSEMLDDAFERAGNQASGFENGIRTQLRSILNNKKKAKGFNPEEITAMKQVVQGGSAENIAKAIGKLGFSEGQSTNMLMGYLGVAGGAAVGGPAGAVSVPLIGQVSRKLAQKLTRKNAELANQIVRAGKDGREVIKAYIKSVPAKERDVAELTELLMRPEISLKGLKATAIKPSPQKKIAVDAVFFADFLQSQKEGIPE